MDAAVNPRSAIEVDNEGLEHLNNLRAISPIRNMEVCREKDSDSPDDEDDEGEETLKKRFDGIIAELRKSNLEEDRDNCLRNAAKLDNFAKDSPWLL